MYPAMKSRFSRDAQLCKQSLLPIHPSTGGRRKAGSQDLSRLRDGEPAQECSYDRVLFLACFGFHTCGSYKAG